LTSFDTPVIRLKIIKKGGGVGFIGGTTKNLMKEVRMKKLIVVLLALMIAVPAVSYAGSATSRWDLTIGGYLKLDLGWSNKTTGTDYTAAPRSSLPTNQNRNDEYGSFFGAGGESRFNFLIKGPDAGAAKTSGVLEADFVSTGVGLQGATPQAAPIGSAGNYASLRLRHAFFKMDWGQYNLIFGQNWYDVASAPPDAFGNADMAPFMKGIRTPQIRWTHNLSKQFYYIAMITTKTEIRRFDNGYGALGQNDDPARGYWPGLVGEIAYHTDACGRIGPEEMIFTLGGFYTKEPRTYVDPNSGGRRWKDDELDVWAAGFRWFVPIIPEKQGNKAGAFYTKGHIWTSQGKRDWAAGQIPAPYADATGVNFHYPVTTTGYGSVGFYPTNEWKLAFQYGALKNHLSNRYMLASANTVRWNMFWGLITTYDVNPAIRFGAQYNYQNTAWAGFGTNDGATVGNVLGKTGDVSTFRIAAWYFF
jgi:hypothetical protein